MKKRITFIFIFMAVPALAFSAKNNAWDFDLKGKVQVENRYFMFTDLNRSSTATPTSDTLTAVQLGGQFDATFKLPQVTLMSQFDVNTDSFGTTSKTNFGPGLSGSQKADTGTYGPQVNGKNNTAHPRGLFGSTNTGPWGLSIGRDGDSNFMFRTLHLNWKNKFANWDVGRMPRHWGLGMFLHNGAGTNDRFMNVLDSILMHKKLGFLHKALRGTELTLGVSKVSNGNNLDDLNDDVNFFEVSLERKRKKSSHGFFYAHQRRSDTNFRSHFYDFYYTRNMGKYAVGLEALFNHGKLGMEDANHRRYGISLENSFEITANKSAHLNVGYASGTDHKDIGTMGTFGFNRNYNPMNTYIMFEQGVGRISAANIGTAARIGADLDANTVFNAIYAGTGLDWMITKKLDLSLSVAGAVTAENLPNIEDEFYGFEVDATTNWEIANQLVLKEYAAVFFPGNLYADEGNQNNFTIDPAIGFGFSLTHTF